MPARVHPLLLEVYLSQTEVAKCPQRLSPLCSLHRDGGGGSPIAEVGNLLLLEAILGLLMDVCGFC